MEHVGFRHLSRAPVFFFVWCPSFGRDRPGKVEVEFLGRYLLIWLVAACHCQLPVTKSTYMKPTDVVTQFWQLYMNIVVTYMKSAQKITWNLNIILLESKNKIFQTYMFRFNIS